MVDTFDIVKTTVEDLKGKKAKMKKIEAVPTDTKFKKLPTDLAKAMRESFKGDFRKIQLHTGGNIRDVSKQVKAKVFTIDQNMYFVKPGDAKDMGLIAHELTHVAQQNGGAMPKTTKGKALVSK